MDGIVDDMIQGLSMLIREDEFEQDARPRLYKGAKEQTITSSTFLLYCSVNQRLPYSSKTPYQTILHHEVTPSPLSLLHCHGAFTQWSIRCPYGRYVIRTPYFPRHLYSSPISPAPPETCLFPLPHPFPSLANQPLVDEASLRRRQTCEQAGMSGDPRTGCNEGIVNCCGQYNPNCPSYISFEDGCNSGIVACCYRNTSGGGGGGGGLSKFWHCFPSFSPTSQNLNAFTDPDPPTGSGSGYGTDPGKGTSGPDAENSPGSSNGGDGGGGGYGGDPGGGD